MRTEALDRYLTELDRRLAGTRAFRPDIVDEVRDHLLEAAAGEEAAGVDPGEAMERALREFGSAAAIANGFKANVALHRLDELAARMWRALLVFCSAGFAIFALVPALQHARMSPGQLPGLAIGQLAGWLMLFGTVFVLLVSRTGEPWVRAHWRSSVAFLMLTCWLYTVCQTVCCAVFAERAAAAFGTSLAWPWLVASAAVGCAAAFRQIAPHANSDLALTLLR